MQVIISIPHLSKLHYNSRRRCTEIISPSDQKHCRTCSFQLNDEECVLCPSTRETECFYVIFGKKEVSQFARSLQATPSHFAALHLHSIPTKVAKNALIKVVLKNGKMQLLRHAHCDFTAGIIPVPVNIAIDSPKGAVSFQCQLRFNKKNSPVLLINQSGSVPSANESASLKILQRASKLKSAL